MWIDAKHLVGHLPRDAASQYAPRLDTLERATYLEVPARVWIGTRSHWDDATDASPGVRGSVTVHLPDPDGIVPFNDLPTDAHTVLPWGRPVQITGEEHHMECSAHSSLAPHRDMSQPRFTWWRSHGVPATR